jgi:EAL domain-containing protein (putative c-di-GMP-specific phosphodiesterase class I)
VSLGLSLLPDDGVEAEDLIRCAEIALSQAKSSGRNLYRFYAEDMNAEVMARLTLERDLHQAVGSGQFELHFHPIILTNDGSLAGAEALIRWQRPGHGLQAPLDFLPVAEQTGLILPIGDWVLREAVDTLIAAAAAGAPLPRMSVNISPRQLRDSEIFEQMHHRLLAANISPKCLGLEIAESALETITSQEDRVLKKIAGFGIDLTVDNYGSGYTSLRRLCRMPFTELKIDKLFIWNLGRESSDVALIDAMLGMARSLGIRTVGQGIETQEQWEFMRERNCDFGQGYLFSKPLNKVEFLSFARDYYRKAG